MNKTLAFVKLDLLSIKQFSMYKQLGLYALVFLFLAFILKDPYILVGLVMVFGLFYAAYPFAAGEKTEIDLLYCSLPMRKKQIILGRYLFALLMDLFSAAIAFLFALGLHLSGFSVDFKTLGLTVLVCFLFYLFIETIQFPIYFRLSYTKARVATLLPLILLPSLLALGSTLFPEGVLESTLSRILDFLGSHMLLSIALLLLFFFIIISISISISYQLYQKREF